MQRSRVNWLTDGDRNTAFFHSHATKRQEHNRILGLENGEEVWCEEPFC